MNSTNTKWIVVLGLTVIATLALSLYLFAKPSTVSPASPPPTSSPESSVTPVSSPAASVEPQSSKQPKITWSASNIQVFLAPGGSRLRNPTFVSSLDLQKVIVEPVPEISG